MGETNMMLRSLELYTPGTSPGPLCASSVRVSRIVALHHASRGNLGLVCGERFAPHPHAFSLRDS